MNHLFQGVQHKSGVGSPADPPADDRAGKSVDDTRHVDEPLPGGNRGEIAIPEHIRCRCAELAVHLVQRAGQGLVEYSRLGFLPRIPPAIPMSFISRANVQRATSKPSLRNWHQTFRTP